MQDDDVISMGGTFARLAKEGLEVQLHALQIYVAVIAASLLCHFNAHRACLCFSEGNASSCCL